MNQEIVKDVGGTLTYDPIEGRASSATVTLTKPDTSELATPTVTIDAVNTTLSAAPAAGDTSISVTSAAGITVGRHYLLTGAGGRREWLRIENVSGTTVSLSDGLGFAYANLDTFVGTRLSVSVSAAQAADLGEGYEARWVYAVGGVTYRPIEQWDVVRLKWPEKLLAPWEFRRYAGSLGSTIMESLAHVGEDFDAEIALATEGVRDDLLSRGLKPSRFRSHVEFKPAVAWRLIRNWAALGQNIPGAFRAGSAVDWVDHVQTEYERAMNVAIGSSRAYDADESGAVSGIERERQVQFTRLSR